MHTKYNYKGEALGDTKKQLSKPEYGTGEIDKFGDPVVKWKEYIIGKADKYGFDKKHKEFLWFHTIRIPLPRNTIIIRYGSERGNYTAPKGTAYDNLALPYKQETVEYNEYRVIADGVIVKCRVRRGLVAPSLDSKGGAIQYHHDKIIADLVLEGVLERINLWEK